jgi:hypothetical protein
MLWGIPGAPEHGDGKLKVRPAEAPLVKRYWK